MRPLPTLAASMTAFPHAIDLAASLDDAEAMMAAHDIRHLPVTAHGALIGVVAATDLLAARTAGRTALGDAVTRDPYVVDVHAPLDGVARELAVRHIGSALVTKAGKLVGIFTATDACLVLAELLEAMRGGPGDQAA